MKQKEMFSVKMIALIGVMAAIVYAVTLYRFPLMGSKVHLANGICLLAGMLLGPIPGGLAAGLGSAIYDATLGGYDFINVMITFVSKFAMAWVCGLMMHREGGRKQKFDRTVLSAVSGALTYVALYMLKNYIYSKFVYGYPPDTIGVTLSGKLIPSLINAGAAIIAAPIFYHAVLPALKAGGLMQQLQKE